MRLFQKTKILGLLGLSGTNESILCQITWESFLDPNHMKMTFHFFPKSGVLRKSSLTLSVVKYELKNSRILVVCDVTTYTNI